MQSQVLLDMESSVSNFMFINTEVVLFRNRTQMAVDFAMSVLLLPISSKWNVLKQGWGNYAHPRMLFAYESTDSSRIFTHSNVMTM